MRKSEILTGLDDDVIGGVSGVAEGSACRAHYDSLDRPGPTVRAAGPTLVDARDASESRMPISICKSSSLSSGNILKVCSTRTFPSSALTLLLSARRRTSKALILCSCSLPSQSLEVVAACDICLMGRSAEEWRCRGRRVTGSEFR
jgi:hypothetical protein